MTAIVVHQGLVDRREIVVPLSKVASFGDEVRLRLSASELPVSISSTPRASSRRPTAGRSGGLDLRSFFLVGVGGWTAAVLPFRADVAHRVGHAGPMSREVWVLGADVIFALLLVLFTLGSESTICLAVLLIAGLQSDCERQLSGLPSLWFTERTASVA